MQKNGYEFVYCKSDVIDTEGNVIAINNRVRRVSYFSTIIVNFIGTSSAIYDTRRIGKIYMKDSPETSRLASLDRYSATYPTCLIVLPKG